MNIEPSLLALVLITIGATIVTLVVGIVTIVKFIREREWTLLFVVLIVYALLVGMIVITIVSFRMPR